MLPSPPVPGFDDAGTAEAQAALALGRLDGALRHLPPAVERILAGHLLREALTGALRQEGHAFTDARFFAWFAGIAALTEPSDRSPTALRAPRPMIIAILTELAHSSWPPLASLALRMRGAMLAFEEGDFEHAHRDAQALIDEARTLHGARPVTSPPLPFALLAQLHDAVAQNTTFAPGGREEVPIQLGDWQVVLERAAAPSPRWAIELLFGERMRAAGLLLVALPLIGLIRLDALCAEDEEDARLIRAAAMGKLARQLMMQVEEAYRDVDRLDTVIAERRRHSRVPMMFEHLAGFGAMRSSQLVILLEATRLGVSKMLSSLDAAGVLERSTVGGVRLYAIRAATAPEPPADQALAPLSLSNAAIAEYGSSMANVDEILARLGVKIERENDGETE